MQATQCKVSSPQMHAQQRLHVVPLVSEIVAEPTVRPFRYNGMFSGCYQHEIPNNDLMSVPSRIGGRVRELLVTTVE